MRLHFIFLFVRIVVVCQAVNVEVKKSSDLGGLLNSKAEFVVLLFIFYLDS